MITAEFHLDLTASKPWNTAAVVIQRMSQWKAYEAHPTAAIMAACDCSFAKSWDTYFANSKLLQLQILRGLTA